MEFITHSSKKRSNEIVFGKLGGEQKVTAFDSEAEISAVALDISNQLYYAQFYRGEKTEIYKCALQEDGFISFDNCEMTFSFEKGIGNIISADRDAIKFTASAYDAHPEAEARYHDFHHFKYDIAAGILKEYGGGDFLPSSNVARLERTYFTSGYFEMYELWPRCPTPYGCVEAFEYQVSGNGVKYTRPIINVINQNNEYQKAGEKFERKIVHVLNSIRIRDYRISKITATNQDGYYSTAICKSGDDAVSIEDIVIEDPLGMNTFDKWVFVGEMREGKVVVHRFGDE